MNLFHHEMLETALFCRLSVPVNSFHFLLYLCTVKVVECDFALGKLCKLKVSDIVNTSCVLEDRRNIGRKIALSVLDTDYHRAVLAGSIYLIGIVLEHNSKRIRAADTDKRVIKRVNRSSEVLLIVVVNKFYRNLGIGL